MGTAGFISSLNPKPHGALLFHRVFVLALAKLCGCPYGSLASLALGVSGLGLLEKGGLYGSIIYTLKGAYIRFHNIYFKKGLDGSIRCTFKRGLYGSIIYICFKRGLYGSIHA